MPNSRITNDVPNTGITNDIPNSRITTSMGSISSLVTIDAGTPIGLLLALTYSSEVKITTLFTGIRPNSRIVNNA